MSRFQTTLGGICRVKNGGLALHFGVESAVNLLFFGPLSGIGSHAACSPGALFLLPAIITTRDHYGEQLFCAILLRHAV